MSVQKAVEYINKIITLVEGNPADDLNKQELLSYLTKTLEELKSNKTLEHPKVEKCECGKDSVCNVFEKNESKRYFCWECFFKYSEKNN